jgi:hypothetical protein
MRHFQRVPVVGRLYPRCWLAEWSWRLDCRWGTHQWPYSDDDEWDEWWEQSGKHEIDSGRWHAF